MNGEWKNGGRPIRNGSAILFDSTYKAGFKEGDFKRIDLGGQVGVGGQYQIGKNGTLFVEARIQIGFLDFWNKLTPMQKNAFDVSLYSKPGGSWRAVSVSLGYFHTFKIPKKSTSTAVKKAGRQK